MLRFIVDIPLLALRSYIYVALTVIVMIFILLPSSIVSYLHFQSTMIPTSIKQLPLQFQSSAERDLFAIINIDEEIANYLAESWDNKNINQFTKLEQVLSIDLKYINLVEGPNGVGKLKVSFYNSDLSRHLKAPIEKGEHDPDSWWPHKPNSLQNKEKFNVYRMNKKFKSWGEIIGKMCMKRLPLFSTELADPTDFDILQYFLPNWYINLFVPEGIQEMLSLKNLKKLFGRNEIYQKKELKNLSSFDLLNSYGDFNKIKSNYFRTGIAIFETKLQKEDLIGTSILIELDSPTNAVFVTESSIILEYAWQGLRWWIYWWPGLCFVIGVGIIWGFSCAGCLFMSWFGFKIIQILRKFYNQADDEKKINIKQNQTIQRNLNELLDSK